MKYLQRFSRGVVGAIEFGRVNVAPLMGLDKAVQHFLNGASGDDREPRTLTMILSTKTFRDVARRRRCGFRKIIAESEVAANRRLLAKGVSKLAQLNGELPGDQVLEPARALHGYPEEQTADRLHNARFPREC